MIIKDFTHTLINGKLCGNYDIYYFKKYDKEQDKSEENILKEIQIKIHAIQKI